MSYDDDDNYNAFNDDKVASSREDFKPFKNIRYEQDRDNNVFAVSADASFVDSDIAR